MSADGRSAPHKATRRDLIAGGIAVAAIILFAGTGSNALMDFINFLNGVGGNTDGARASAVLLNIALLLFAWRRYTDLRKEVAERGAAEARVQLLAYRDPLTNLCNRRAFVEATAEQITLAATQHRAVALLLIDLDHFKNVNDLHGHAVGDELLRNAARRISDALPAGAICGRLGGDEFACSFSFPSSDQGQAETVAGTILTAMGTPFRLGPVQAHIGASCGIARSDAGEEGVDALLRRADVAMYAAKKAGRNQLAWFDTSMDAELRLRTELEAGLRDGIPRGEFVPYYEQQIDMMTGQLHGFEVLARWEHPTKGLLPPSDFIPAAEETGLIDDLSMSVMRQAFEQARHWDPRLTLSVNISPGQLKDPWLAQKIVKLLLETGFPANRLEIEITETSLFENLALAQTTIDSLKNQGIRLALDDFGTGYSSLAHLRALPFDRIKIDRSFVTSINESGDSAAIVDAITQLGLSLNLPITAEGVETAAIEQRLMAIGDYKGQGWLFGKPMNLMQVQAFLAEQPGAAQVAIDIQASVNEVTPWCRTNCPSRVGPRRADPAPPRDGGWAQIDVKQSARPAFNA
jgi:diguanylate cyclase (GGDEF)-like protein